ncbi:uncharacterized protein LOC135939185 [Cloeon dipterum]|uniref:uncharacterized protein LOC135939185 n=1 Tax=Cloeon dipterum TaxID=197152 RepID=UPI00321FC6BC
MQHSRLAPFRHLKNAGRMSPFLCAIILLGLYSSLASAANFSQVYEWPDVMDYEWPSEEIKIKTLKTFKQEYMYPRSMVIYGSRLFLSLQSYGGVILPVTLVSLPMSGASSASPKLTPVPSWDMHKNGNCDKIEEATGIQVDSVGRLWVLDNGSDNCKAKIWTIDLMNGNRNKIIHRFSFSYGLHDLVLDETPSGTLAFISRWRQKHIIVFSLEKNQSWNVYTPGIRGTSIAITPKNKEIPRQIYLGNYLSAELKSISVDAIRNGTGTVNGETIFGNWTERPYRMRIDNHGTMYAAFWFKNYISSFRTSMWPFLVRRIYEVAGLDDNAAEPFAFASDQKETLWLSVFDRLRKPRYRLLKAADEAKSISASRTRRLW